MRRFREAAVAESSAQPKLTSDPQNANKGTVRGLGMVERSLQSYGAGRSILASNDGVILAGNKTYDRAIELGIPVQEIESDGKTLYVIRRTDLAYDDPRAKELAIADNRASETGLEWDANVLSVLADDGVDLSQFWFDDELTEVLTALDEPILPGLTDPDEVPEPPVDPVTKPSDVWLLGKHRVMCGDATVVTDVDRLMDGKRADMVFTDPPYGVAWQSAYRTATPQFRPIANDDVVMIDWIPLAAAMLADGGACYVCTRWDVYQKWYEAIGQSLSVKNLIVWHKPEGGPGDLTGDYRPCHELIVFAVKGRHLLNGKRDDNVWSDQRDAPSSYQHPTQKPIALATRAIGNSTKSGDIVLDLFGGSGSTLIACQESGRVAAIMELDPAYCDVIVKRWENHTGLTATLEAAR